MTSTHRDDNQTCPLRGLNVCDGHVIAQIDAGLRWCLCDLQSAAREVEWHDIAAGHVQERDELAESIRRHPSSGGSL